MLCQLKRESVALRLNGQMSRCEGSWSCDVPMQLKGTLISVHTSGETNSIRGTLTRLQWFLIKVGFGLAAFFYFLLVID